MKKLSVALVLLLCVMISGCGNQTDAAHSSNVDDKTSTTTSSVANKNSTTASNAAKNSSNNKTIPSSWSLVGETPWSYSQVLANFNGQLFVGTEAGVCSWDGSAWSKVGGSGALGRGPGAQSVSSLAVVEGILYAGTGDGVRSWGGSASGWLPCEILQPPTQEPAVINSLASVNGTLYAGTNWGGVWPWDGSSWSQVGGSGGLPKNVAAVLSLLMDNGTLYAGTWHDGVWSWDGAKWFSLGGTSANSLLAINGTLYAGTDNDGVMEWDGSAWSCLGGSAGLKGKATKVTSLLAVNGTLYAGTENGVWSWDGSAWLQVGGSTTDFGDGVLSLVAINSTLYAGTSGSGVFRIARPSSSPSSNNAAASTGSSTTADPRSQTNTGITQEKAAAIITDYLLLRGISKDKDSNLVITLDRTDNAEGKEYFVFHVFNNMSDHIATIGWYGVQKNDSSLYDFTLMTPIK